ncbi:hypothetical protein BPAE_0031g00110 [Botrytis paeoniae]|uniref:SAP domain-containing protein n=1 Tax=Botrytis paeoniae TaxID=278948 RepID=A0A4Z1FTT0_9HELO|nr:hypothetical protein BPAE_0031g00110 [Botrytis paeoniae]
MPPTKRPLGQADTNAILPPKKKHKEKDVTLSDDHASKSKGELVEMLKERSMPSNGTKDVLIQRLRDNEGHVAAKDSGKTERRKSARIDAAEQSVKITERREEGLKDLWTFKNKALATPSAPIAEKSSATSSRNTAAVLSQSSHGHRTNYRTKDNSKLRALLRDWRRYKQLMNWVEGEEGDKSYQDLEVAGLRSLMDLRQQGRKTKFVCEDSELIDWLEADDQKLARKNKVEISTLMGSEVPAELKRWENKLADTRADLESRIGHPLPAEVPTDESSKHDVPVVTKKAGDQGSLNYDPKKTNWGLFSAWELCRIAMEKGAPGYGTKDAMIKWLETGILEYEDMHLESLREQCWKRLVPQYSNDDKAALIERLKILDKHNKDSEESSTRETSKTTDAENIDQGSVEQADEIFPVVEPSTIVLLRDRHLQISGTREETIHRLETSPYNYESYTSEELSLILKDRHLTNASYGSKEIKSERLKNSDEALYDSAKLEDTQLYVQLNLREKFIKDKEQALKALSDPNVSYEKLDSSALRELATALGLSPHSGEKIVIKQLHANDQKLKLEGKDRTAMSDAINKLIASLETRKDEYNKAKEDLDKSIGHPVLDIAIVMGRYNAIMRRDHEIVNSYQPIHKPGLVCDYDWKDSHWAGKTERELRDMCQRQGMEGWGTKATCIKWLETGSVEYEDLLATSLEMMCRKRGIKFKSGTKRLELAMKLRETDEKETAYRELGIMALKKMCKERDMKTTSGETKQDLITRLRVADERTGRV